jgi:hypothetical protein
VTLQPQKTWAVITGDIVRSSSLSGNDLEQVRAQLLSAFMDVRGWGKRILRGRPDFFRGDAWQILLSDPGRALRVALYIRSQLISTGIADTRLSIGIGRVDALSRRRVSLSTGEAFTLSGRGLDRMSVDTGIAIECPQSAGPLTAWLAVTGQLCDSLVRGWTRRQASVVAFSLHPQELTQDEIAALLRPAVSRQSVTKTLDSANWDALRAAIGVFEATSWDEVV